MKSVLVIGMGTFGVCLASKMLMLKNDVMIVDNDEEIINRLAPTFTDAQIGDCTNPAVIDSLGVNTFDICFVAIGDNFQSSLEITSLLKEHGAKHVVAKSVSDIQSKFLLRNGADEVVHPEREMAEKLAIRHNAKNIFDYIELTPEYGIYEIPLVKGWENKSISSLNIRRKYDINVLAIKNHKNINPAPGPDYVFDTNDNLIVLGSRTAVYKLTEKT